MNGDEEPTPRDSTKRFARLPGLVAAVYFILLTIVLAVPNPWRLLGPLEQRVEEPWHWAIDWLRNDKVQHAVVYAIGAGCLLWAGFSPVTTLALCTAHGGFVEIVQHFSPPRSLDFFDWLADVVGVNLILLAYFFRERRFFSN